MFEKDFRVLRLRSVAGIRIHHELGIGQVLSQEKGVDRHDDDVFIPTHNQRSLLKPSQHRVAVLRDDRLATAPTLLAPVTRRVSAWRDRSASCFNGLSYAVVSHR